MTRTAATAVPVLNDPTPADPRGPGGLLALVQGQERPLPLTGIRVRTALAGDVARTVVTQTFTNALDGPVEAVHLFPLPEDGAVTELVLEAGDLVVQAECREREEAQAVFDQAREQGHRAALLTAERDDVHTLRVTNLPPGETVRVRIVVVERLQSVDGRVRWRFPTVIAPRYLPGQPTGHQGPGVLPDTDHVPDASRLQPPLRLEGGTTLDLEVHVAGPVTSVASVLHAVRMDLDDGDVRIAPQADATADRDFVLEVGHATAQVCTPRAWTDGQHTLVLVGPPAAALPPALPRDAVFVIDISGSMGGRKMIAAREALRTALRGLVPGDRFRLIAFDDRIEPHTPDLVPFDQEHLAAAESWIEGLGARGGTEMLPPIREALSGSTPDDRLRTVLFITDGQAWNTSELVAAVANRRKQTRFFTLGIDTAVNGALLKRLARVGRGTCELLTPSDDIEAAVARIEARFGSPILDQVQVQGAESATGAPSTVFSGRPAALLVQGAPDPVHLTGRGPQGAWSAQVTPHRIDLELGPLWARQKIAALEDRLEARPHEAEGLRGAIVELGLEHHLATRFTAFVAVERTRTVQGELQEVVQPVELPATWEAEAVGGAPAGAVPMAAPMAAPMSSGAVPPPPVASPRRTRASSKKKAESRAAAKGARRSGLVGAMKSFFGAGGPSEPAESEELADGLELADAMHPASPPASAPSTTDDPARTLARTQDVDGSFGGDVLRTAAALLALVWLGHTRRTGLRRRVVLKAATWLQSQDHDLARRALQLLEAAEAGSEPVWEEDLEPLLEAVAEGKVLESVRD